MGSIDIIFQDKSIIVVNKGSGCLVQGDITKRESLYSRIKKYIADGSNTDDPFVGIVHRLDFQVSGVVVFALASKIARFLSEQFSRGNLHKEYLAVVESEKYQKSSLENGVPQYLYCHRENERTVITDQPGYASKSISIRIERIASESRFTLLKVYPKTGRKHQIRAVLSYYNIPVVGDRKYGSPVPFMKDSIALHCRKILLSYPVRYSRKEFLADIPFYWEVFENLIGPGL